MTTSSLFAYDHIADRVRLYRQSDKRPVVVVEGPSDRRFLGRISGNLVVEVAGTRDRAINTAYELRALGIGAATCLVDRDFDDVVAIAEAAGAALTAYDNADLEAMLWDSSTLDDVLGELGSEIKLRAFGGVDRLRFTASQVLMPLSRLRRANAVNSWGLDFDGIDLPSKVDRTTLAINELRVCDALWKPGLPITKQELYRIASDGEVPTCPETGHQMIRGRDALAVAAVALRKLLGNLRSGSATLERLEEALRLAADGPTMRSSAWMTRLSRLLAA